MRSVIRKPLTMLVIEAATATVPRMVVRLDSRSPAMRIEPTTAIAEMALVSDISGVCSSRETFWMTWKPTNVASMNTKTIDQKSKGVPLTTRVPGCWVLGCRCYGAGVLGARAHYAVPSRVVVAFLRG